MRRLKKWNPNQRELLKTNIVVEDIEDIEDIKPVEDIKPTEDINPDPVELVKAKAKAKRTIKNK